MGTNGWCFPTITGAGEVSGEEGGEPSVILWDGHARRGALLHAPVASITGRASGLEAEGFGERRAWDGNPLDHLDGTFAWATEGARRRGLDAACFAGALHYDLRRCVERYPAPAPDDQGLPWIRWFLFSKVSPWSPPVRGDGGTACTVSEGRSSLPQATFEGAVRRILRHELDGDVYQVNLTRQVELVDGADPFDLWCAASATSPAPFAAYADLGGFRLLSLSPERFLLREGGTLTTQPIKGTAPRGFTPEEDRANLERLLSGEKEAAELAMIVDVERNDLGRVAVPGSVRVEAHREVITLPNVHHLASTVRATLRPGVSLGEILRATFPGGSVTGAPKIRAMQIVDALEPVSRGFYCGALGWMDLEGNFDLSLTIRTATASGGSLRLGVGGGIVVDSDPAAEWLETVAKARCFVREQGST